MTSGFRASAFAMIGLATVAMAMPAQAQSKLPIDQCVNKGYAFKPDDQIKGCTAAIDSGKWSGQGLEWAYSNRGLAYIHKGDYDRAVADLDKAIELDPKSTIAHYNRANAYGSKGDLDRAIADLDKAIELDPNYAMAYNDRGIIYDRKGDFDHAIADLSKAAHMDPGQARFHNSICWLRGVAGRDLADALEECDDALKIAKTKNAYVYNSRGLVQFKSGDYSKAIEDFSAAIEQEPRDADSLYARGISKLKAGDKMGGATDIAAAKQINPDVADVWARFGVK